LSIRGIHKNRATLAIAAVLVVALAVPLLASGCGAATPQDATSSFINAINSRDYNAYLNSVLPENVMRMTEADKSETKKQFEASDTKYNNIKFKTIPDKSDKNMATVELTSGTITGTNPQTKKKESTTIEDINKTYKQTLSLKVRKYKGKWYVDVPVASADQQTQQAPQQ
jgi:hypothetical protein